MLNKNIGIFTRILQVLFFSALGLSLSLIILAKQAQSAAVILYVDADYIGTETGSETQPFSTIQEAHDASTDGVAETIFIRAGTANMYTHVVITKGGVGPDNPDIYTVWPDTGSYPKILEDTANLIKVNASYVTIDGMELDGSAGSNTADLIRSDEAIAASYVTIRNCKIHNSDGDEGIQLKNAPNAWIENVESYNNDGDGINICCGSDNSTLRLNYSHDNTGDRAHGGIYVYDTDTITLEFNVLVHNSEAGIQIENVSTSIIRSNLTTNNITNTDKKFYGDGILVDGNSDNNLIVNNTAYSNTTDGIRIDETSATTNVIRNNIVVANKEYGLRAAITQTHDHNLSWNNVISNWGGVLTMGATDVPTDPVFVTGPTGPEPNFYLNPSSPAVNTGSQTAVAADFSLHTTRTDERGDQGIVDLGYHYPALPFTLTIVADPSTIVADGTSTTTLTATIRTEAGNPVPDGRSAIFTTTSGLFDNATQSYTTTSTQGLALAVLHSASSSSTLTATVQVKVSDKSTETLVIVSPPEGGIYMPLIFKNA